MQEAFAYVLFGTVAVGVIAGLFCFVKIGTAYDQIGKGGFFREDDDGRRRDAPVNVVERDAEIRQMLEARNARRAAAGKEVVDIDQELARLTAPSIDDQLRSEIRELVVARNRRRERRGQAPLDVDAEVERQVAELGG